MPDKVKQPDNTETVGEAQYREQLLREVYAKDPLGDKAFKKLLESDEWFRIIAEMLLSHPIPEGAVISIQGEKSLTVNGKLIRMDNFRSTPAGVVNLEAQKKAEEFTFRRHLFYGAVSYAFTLQEGQDYETLQSAVSIVIYKKKGNAGLIENACLEGTLIHDDEERNLLTLAAVNAEKWREADNMRMRQFLSVMYNGIYQEENAGKFKGVDTEAEFFKAVNRAVRRASAYVKYEESKGEGNKMAKYILTEFLTEEQVREAEEKGIEKGIEQGMGKMAQINRLYRQKKSLSEIAAEVKIAPEEVKAALEELGYDVE